MLVDAAVMAHLETGGIDKAKPAGVQLLAEVIDVTKQGF
jgi:hypothetical protein